MSEPSSSSHAIGIDLGGSKIEIILTDGQPLNIIARKRVPCEKNQGYPHLLNQLTELIETMKSKVDQVASIGLGLPGSLNPETQLVRNCNVICLNGKPLAKDLEQRVNQPVSVANDANCFTLSEALLGAGKNYRTVMGIIVGTGLGGGIVIDGQVHIGASGYAAEFGHTSIDYQGVPCWCGQRGCIENYLSGTGIERIYQELSGTHQATPKIYQDYLQQHPIAVACFEQYLDFFARGLANLIYFFDPEVIVLGGGVSKLPILYSEGKRRLCQNHFKQEPIDVNILPNQLGDASGVYGAVLIGQQQQATQIKI